MTYVVLTLCIKLRCLSTLLVAVLSISNVTVMNLRCFILLYVIKSVEFSLFQNLVAMATGYGPFVVFQHK